MFFVSCLSSGTTNNERTLEKLKDIYQFARLWFLFCWFFFFFFFRNKLIKPTSLIPLLFFSQSKLTWLGILSENQNALFIDFLILIFFSKMYSRKALHMIVRVVQMDCAASTCGQNMMMSKVLCMWIIHNSVHWFIFSWRSRVIEGKCQWSYDSRKSIPSLKYVFSVHFPYHKIL